MYPNRKEALELRLYPVWIQTRPMYLDYCMTLEDGLEKYITE